MDKEYVIIDVETSGGDPRTDRITEIAIYRFNGKKVVDSFVSLINPTVPIPDFITRITGITNEMVKDSPKFYEVAKRIVEITQDAVFVAHNARFDYGFVQKEFRQLGYTFSRKQLCTVKLSRRLLPGLKSYSLGNLCIQLGIENEAAHRAWGDATATLKLLKLLLNTGEEETLDEVVGLELENAKIPPNLEKSVIDELPEETGVYYFLGKDGKVIYIGKSKNIRKRILSHLQGSNKTLRTLRMVEQMHGISYELTGSELVALLLENDEIKRFLPPYNRAQRRLKYKIGVYAQASPKGYIELFVDKYDESKNPVAGFTNRNQAEGSVQRRGKKYELCPKYYGAERGKGRCFHHQLHICKGACVGEEDAEPYNQRVAKVISELSYGKGDLSNFFIVGAGRNYEERSVVWVNNGMYKGYAYIDPEMLNGDPYSVIDSISLKREVPGVQRIIQSYIKRHPREVKPFSNR